jgi:hypothetical protein
MLHELSQFESRENHSCLEGCACESRSRRNSRNSWVTLRTCLAVLERPKTDAVNHRHGAPLCKHSGNGSKGVTGKFDMDQV